MTRHDTQIASQFEGCVATATRLLDRVVMGVYDEALRPFDLKSTQLSLLVFVGALSGADAGPTASDLAPRMRIDQTTLSRNLDGLARRGLVVLDESPRDARARVIRLTADGRALLRRALPAWERCQARVREALRASLSDQIVRAAGRLSAGSSVE